MREDPPSVRRDERVGSKLGRARGDFRNAEHVSRKTTQGLNVDSALLAQNGPPALAESLAANGPNSDKWSKCLWVGAIYHIIL